MEKIVGDLSLATEEERQQVLRRLQRLSLHLLHPAEQQQQLAQLPCAARRQIVVDQAALKRSLYVKYKEERDRLFDFFKSRPDLMTPVDISMPDHRDLTMRQLVAMVREGGFRPFSYLFEDTFRFVAVFDAAGRIDTSLGIKIGVQCSLWGGSVINLGTQKHWDKYFEGIDNLEYTGCFAMTELHHGSNVQGLQTSATFDPSTDEFVINTPNDGAIKWWIGNAALHGKFATVFAKLILPPKGPGSSPADMGVHAFVVPIRDLRTHDTLPGVEIQDCGHKVGLNGVDNGALRFNSVRVPRDNLLNRFGDVARDGTYSSTIPSASKRFAAMLGELVGGRVGIGYQSMSMLKVGVTIAVRYSLLRQQFGPPKQPEVSILDYQSHQNKLMPMLASSYAFHFACDFMVERYSEAKRSSDELGLGDVHSLTAGLKAYITSYTAKALSSCREACGGHGYAAVNRFGTLRNDHDIFQTFEGDNTVLLQQVAGDLLKEYRGKFQGGAVSATWSYLKESMGSYLAQPNPVTARWEGEEHLRDPKFQLDAFRYRASRLLQSAAMRLSKHTKTLGSFGAWNRCLNHLLTLAESHIESIILARFIHCVQRCPDKNTRDVLKLVCDLYALDRIRDDIGTYRNQDYVAPNKAKAINKLTAYLCYQVRGIANELVDAFDFPDHVIRAPIAMKSQSYSDYTQGVGF